MTARVRDFNEFLQTHVNLNQTRVDTLQRRISALDNYLSERSEFADLLEGDVIPQGSFAHKTIIKPYSGNDFDADVLLPMQEQADWAPKMYTIKLKRALDQAASYADKTILGKRCVTIDFANDFHIDVVPFIKCADGLTYITHRTDDVFIRQDPVAFTNWIKTKARVTNGHLIRVIRLVKYLRDRSSIAVPSVVIAALIAGRVRSFADDADYSNVATTLTSLLEDLNGYIRWMSAAPFIDDCIGGNLADRVTQSGFRNLQSQIKTWAEKSRSALDASQSESVEAWQRLFGSSFGVSSTSATLSESKLTTEGARRVETYENIMAPGEQTLEEKYGIATRLDPSVRMRIVGRFSPRANGKGRPRPMSSYGDHVPGGRELTFTIEDCNLVGDYDVYWKVRNAGAEAARLRNFRGEIRKAGVMITERSKFPGAHWAEAWIVKDGFAIATARQDVTILQK